MAPEEPLILRVDDLGQIASPLRHSAPDFVKAVQALQQKLWQLPEAAEVEIPEDLRQLAAPASRPDKVGELVATLAQIAGQTVQTVDVGNGDITLVGAGHPIPEDFAPTVILDASGRVRSTYRLWERHRANLKRLPAAANDYGQLDVHLWERGSGQVTLGKPGAQLQVAEVLCRLIDGDPEGEWLIVHYKSQTGIVDILKADPERSRRIKSLTWGRHHGTNEFADVRNVVVIGQLTYRPIDYKAIASAASGLPVGSVDAEADLEDVRWGEFQHHLLQALCRASVRKSRNGIAGACRAYVIATPSPHTEGRVRDTFPGCRLYRWTPVQKAVSEAASKAMDFLRSKADSGVAEARKREVCDYAGVTPKNFSRDVGQVPAFQAFLKETGWQQGAHKFTKAFFPVSLADDDDGSAHSDCSS